MMNKRIELIVYFVLFLVFGALSIGSQSCTYLHFTLSLWLTCGAMLGITRYLVYPAIKRRRYLQAVVVYVTTFGACFLVTGFFCARWLAELFSVESVSYFEGVLLEETVPFLLVTSVVGLLRLVDLRKANVRKSLYYFAGIVVLAAVGFFVKYAIDVSYKGDDSIRFVEGDYKTLEALLSSEQFSDKTVYVDLWFSSCGPLYCRLQKASGA